MTRAPGPRTGSLVWAMMQRRALLRTLRLLCGQPAEKRRDLPNKLRDLKQLFGINEELTSKPSTGKTPQQDEGGAFVTDETAEQLTLELVDVINKVNSQQAGEEDLSEVEWVLHTLLIHVSPPIGRKKMPGSTVMGLSILKLANANLHQKVPEMRTLRTLLLYNKTLQHVELSYTGISNKELLDLLPIMGKLPDLAFLGLKGNRLDKGIFVKLTSILSHRKQFPSLIWIDLRNNTDIWTLPQDYLTLLQKRWPTKEDGQLTYTARDLAEGKSVVKDGTVEMNI